MPSIASPIQREEGFTLIELLVVIIIVGILAAIAIPLFLDQRKLAVDASVKADVRNTLANIKTWQANDANANKAIANTGDFVSATNGGKVAQSPGNSIGISISSTGDTTVCGYNAGGKTYLSDSAAYVFSPATGQFTTGSCASGSTTGGTASGGSGSGSADLVGGVSNGVYTATAETGDSTNSMWDTSAAGRVFSTAKAHGGTTSFSTTWSGGSINGAAFIPNPTLLNSKSYTVGVWVYPATTASTDVKVNFLNTTSRVAGATTQVTVDPNKWTYVSVTGTTAASGNYAIQFGPNATGAGGTSGTLYMDDLTITPN